jgi:hypothetical protein
MITVTINIAMFWSIWIICVMSGFLVGFLCGRKDLNKIKAAYLEAKKATEELGKEYEKSIAEMKSYDSLMRSTDSFWRELHGRS